MAILQRITQGFFRPIETSGAMTLFYIDVGGGGVSVGFRDGVEASVLTLLENFQTLYAASNVTLELTSEWKVKFSHASSNIGITATTSTALLGFTADIPATTTSITAPYTPLFCWFPTHKSYDGSRQWQDQGERFKGAMGASGGKFGVTLPGRYRRNFLYSTNFSANTYSEAERDTYTISSVDYYPNAERSFQEVMDSCNTVQLQNTTSGNVNPKGCYYIDRAYEYTGASPVRILPITMDAGGIHFSLDDNSKRDNYLFCQLDGTVTPPAQSTPQSAAFYQPQFSLSSDDTPNGTPWVTS